MLNSRSPTMKNQKFSCCPSMTQLMSLNRQPIRSFTMVRSQAALIIPLPCQRLCVTLVPAYYERTSSSSPLQTWKDISIAGAPYPTTTLPIQAFRTLRSTESEQVILRTTNLPSLRTCLMPMATRLWEPSISTVVKIAPKGPSIHTYSFTNNIHSLGCLDSCHTHILSI